MPQPQLDETLVSLFETNAGCRFPCWRGITPGKTTWEQAFQILEPLSYKGDYVDPDVNSLFIVGIDTFDGKALWQKYYVDQNQAYLVYL